MAETTWRDRIDSELKGSFKGVDFHVESSDTQGGRRWLVHEYPRRDTPYAEDMGKKARQWRLTFFVAGDDYDRWRDSMIAALDSEGAGTLVHPYLGTFTAVATEPRWRESTREGGVCTFEVTFIQAGEVTYPTTAADTRRDVRRAADALETATIDDFADKWDVEGLLGNALTGVEQDLYMIVSEIEEVAGDVTDKVADEIRAPANMAGIVIDGFDRLKNAALRPVQALDLYSGSSLGGGGSGGENSNVIQPPGTPRRTARMLLATGNSGESVEPPKQTTPERIKRAENTIAARRLNRRAAAMAAARLVADTDWTSRADAQAAGDDALSLIDSEMTGEDNISDAAYAALVKLRAAVSRDLRKRATALPGLTVYTPQVTLPALVIAHRLYGDAKRADEIVIRNNIDHPGAVRGGMELEVLSE